MQRESGRGLTPQPQSLFPFLPLPFDACQVGFLHAKLPTRLLSRKLKRRRFWATHFSWKWGLLTIYICLYANKFVLLSFFSLIKTISPRVSTKPQPNDAKVHFRLTSVAQKRCCLSSLVSGSLVSANDHKTRNNQRLEMDVFQAFDQRLKRSCSNAGALRTFRVIDDRGTKRVWSDYEW